MKVRQYLPTGNVGHFQIAGVPGATNPMWASESTLPVPSCWTAWATTAGLAANTAPRAVPAAMPPATGWAGSSPGSEGTGVFHPATGIDSTHTKSPERASKIRRGKTVGVLPPVNPWAPDCGCNTHQAVGFAHCCTQAARHGRAGLHGCQTRRGLGPDGARGLSSMWAPASRQRCTAASAPWGRWGSVFHCEPPGW